MSGKFAHSEHTINGNVRCQRDDFKAPLSHTANMTSDNPFPANLKAARKAKGWSLETLAAEAETSKGYLSELERGTRPTPPGAFLDKLAAALETTAAALFGEAPDQGDRIRRTVPLVGYVGAGGQAHYGSGDVLGEVDAPENATDTTVAAEMRGESMGPLLDGWLVFWDEVRSPVTPDMHGQLCVVGLPGDKVFVKQIRPSSTDGLYHLISNAEGPMLDMEILWAAKVTEMRPR